MCVGINIDVGHISSTYSCTIHRLTNVPLLHIVSNRVREVIKQIVAFNGLFQKQ